MSFVNSINITVDAISRLLPDQQHFAETVLYDLRSFAKSHSAHLPICPFAHLTTGTLSCSVR